MMAIKTFSLIAFLIICYIILNRALFYEPVFETRKGRRAFRFLRNEFLKQKMIDEDTYNLEVLNNSIREFTAQMHKPIHYLKLWHYYRIKQVRDAFIDIKEEFESENSKE